MIKSQQYCINDPLFIAICEQERNRFVDTIKPGIEAVFNRCVDNWEKASMRDRVVWLNGRGRSNREIADELQINLKTVRRFLRKMESPK